LHRVLTIDLSEQRFSIEANEALFEEAVGGAGVAIRLLEAHCPQDADPLGPENPIIFAVGPLVGLYPLASKTVAMFKSPHTGNLGESHAGGRSAVSIRMAGYGAIIIKGRSRRPVYLVIEDGEVSFRDASALWGLRSSYTVGSVLREREKGSGHRSILRIGPAGEKQVPYACVITETYRHFGRLGLGAVFGSKQLKGIVIVGRRTIPVADRRRYMAHYATLYNAATDSPLMRKYHDLGTAMNILPLNELGGLPTRNLQTGRFESADALSGEHLAEAYLGRRLACAHCPVACIHIAALRTPHPSEPYFYKTTMLGYDYEPIYALGTMLGLNDPSAMLRLTDEVEIQGLDAMSTGVVLAWATEAQAKRLLSVADTDGIALHWGDGEGYLEATRRLVSQPTAVFQALARGVAHAAALYGGEDFALSFGGNEMPGYHTGPACHLGVLLGSRHSHLASAGYSIDQKELRPGNAPVDLILEKLRQEEAWRQVLASLVVCFFARGLYTPEAIVEALATAGRETDAGQLTTFGERVLEAKQAFKRREGFDPAHLKVPARITETPTPLGTFDEEYYRRALDASG
jgi:aldehyde:ferredoxin oxidoreductase